MCDIIMTSFLDKKANKILSFHTKTIFKVIEVKIYVYLEYEFLGPQGQILGNIWSLWNFSEPFSQKMGDSGPISLLNLKINILICQKN